MSEKFERWNMWQNEQWEPASMQLTLTQFIRSFIHSCQWVRGIVNDVVRAHSEQRYHSLPPQKNERITRKSHETLTDHYIAKNRKRRSLARGFTPQTKSTREQQQHWKTTRFTANVKEEESHIKSNWKEPDINHTLCFLFIVCLFRALAYMLPSRNNSHASQLTWKGKPSADKST